MSNHSLAICAGVRSLFEVSYAAWNAADKPSDAKDETDPKQNPEPQHDVVTILKVYFCETGKVTFLAMQSDWSS